MPPDGSGSSGSGRSYCPSPGLSIRIGRAAPPLVHQEAAHPREDGPAVMSE